MKGSKKLGKSILVIALSIVLLISAVAPLTVMGSENNGGGLKGTSLGQYRYYVVQSTDTLTSIANKNGITVSDIMTYNELDSTDEIYRGQILKLPVTSENTGNQIISTSITVKAKESNVKDLISSIAYNAGYTVIYKGSGTETITVDLEKVSPLKAIDYVTRMVGLSYLKDGNTILVASAVELNSTFVDSLVLTKFSFDYVTYDEIIGQATALGLSDMKTVSQTNNGRDVWISAYPKEMAKLAELIEILDAPENISVGSNSIASAFTPIELDYISAADFSSLLSNLGLHSGLTMTVRPMTLFVYVSGTQLADIMTIKKVVDTEAVLTLDGTAPIVTPDTNKDNNEDKDAVDTDKENVDTNKNDVVDTDKNDAVDTNKNDATDKNDNNNIDNIEPETKPNTTPDDTTIEEEVVEEPKIFEKIDLVNISRSDAESLISKSGADVSTFGHERMTKSLWLHGTPSEIATVKGVIEAIDGNVASAASTVHTYTAQNCTVDELMARLEGVTYENVKFYLYSHSSITNSIIVYCDDVTWNNEILELLQTLDAVDVDGKKTWIPIASKADDNKNYVLKASENTVSIMKELYPEVFTETLQYRVVVLETAKGDTNAETGETTGAAYKAVLYVNATSAQATRMTKLIEALDNA